MHFRDAEMPTLEDFTNSDGNLHWRTEGVTYDDATRSAVVEAIDNNASTTVHSLAMQIRDAEQKVSRQASDLSAQQLEIDDLIRQLQKKENEITLRDSQIEELETRLNARNRWQFWFDRGRDAS